MSIFDEPYVSEEQQKDYDLLVKLSNEINEDIEGKRRNAINILMDEAVLLSKKRPIIKTYVRDRVYFGKQKIQKADEEYLYDDLFLLAQKLFHDRSFWGNDSPYVINGLAFYENSLSFEDAIIAFHNYRYEHDEEDLWWLVLLLARYIYSVLSMDGKYNEIDFERDATNEEVKRLVNYISDFWNKYLRNIDVLEYSLTDDKKPDVYELMDNDAGHYFAAMDAVNEDELQKIDSKYAAELVSYCSKSIYLLLSTLREMDNQMFIKDVKKLRSIVFEMCEGIYGEEIDAHGELEKDIRLNADKMELFEKDNEIRLLKYTMQNALEKMRGQSVETTLQSRQEALQNIKIVSDTDELLEEFTKEFSGLLMNSITDNLDVYYQRLESELGAKYQLLPQVALNALASAEYLYDMFVRKPAPSGFDYSGIAVLYFQAFETAYDMLLIERYADWLKTKEIDKNYAERQKIKKKKSKRTEEERKRLEKLEETLNKYFSGKFYKDYFYQKNNLVTCLEIGKFQRFIDLAECLEQTNDSTGSELIYFLESECFKKKINVADIDQFAKSVENATDPRNKAAHGLHGLKECDVKADKIIVYDETNITDILNFKNLLYAFLDFFLQS